MASGRGAGVVELWVPITVAAAFLQCVRTALQKHLSAELSTNATNFTRYVYGFPLALVYLAVLTAGTGLELPRPNPTFLFFCVLGGLAQIFGTSLLIRLFSLRNFAVGTTYSKTEAVQTVIFGIVILGEPVSVGALIGIVVSVLGVMTLSVVRSHTGAMLLLTAWTQKVALIGLASGGLFGVAAVSIRAASLSLGGEGFIMPAAFTLAVITTLQTLILGAYLLWRERAQLRLVAVTWRRAAPVGVMSVVGSGGWFVAMTIENAAYVRTLGQVELVFTFIASHIFFGERSNRSELAGILLIVLGIVLLLNLR